MASLISSSKATKPLISFSLLTFIKKVQLIPCNFCLFAPRTQNISSREGILVLGDNLSKPRRSKVDLLFLSHSFKEPAI